jgi:pSer/pThr/pTyr-binding forkhead associated (FHA) protein
VIEITFALALWLLRILFILLVYLLLFQAISALQRSLARSSPVSERGLAYLVVTDAPKDGARRGQRFPLRAVTSLGGDPGNDVVVNDDYASARHSVVSFDGSQWWVEDMGSTNGTFLNGEQIDRRTALHYGDEIELGRLRLRLERA